MSLFRKLCFIQTSKHLAYRGIHKHTSDTPEARNEKREVEREKEIQCERKQESTDGHRASAELEHKHTAGITVEQKPVERLFMIPSQSGASVLSHHRGTNAWKKATHNSSANTVAINQKQDAGLSSGKLFKYNLAFRSNCIDMFTYLLNQLRYQSHSLVAFTQCQEIEITE